MQTKSLQRGELLFHVLKSHLTHLIKDTMLKFVNRCQVAQSCSEGTLATVNFADTAIQVSGEKTFH